MTEKKVKKVPVVPTASDLGDMEADTIRYEERFGLRVSKQVEEMNRADERMYGPGHFGELSD